MDGDPATAAITPEELRSLVAAALPLYERLDRPGPFAEAADGDPAAHRLTRWCRGIADGEGNRYRRRLRWDGWSFRAVRAALANTAAAATSEEWPPWVETLRAVVRAPAEEDLGQGVEGQAGTTWPSVVDATQPLPFEDVWEPAVRVARGKLVRLAGQPARSREEWPFPSIAPEAYHELERSLLYRLASVSARALQEDFSRFRPAGHTLLPLLVGGQVHGAETTGHYRAFCRRLLSTGLLPFFRGYPVAARLVALAIDFWVETAAELLARLAADQAAIARVFLRNPGAEIGRVAALGTDLSDAHGGGRMVMRLRFESGLDLIYKPRPVGLESAFQDFLGWCNDHGAPLGLRVLRVLDRGRYGWVEYAAPRALESGDCAARFFERAGSLLCLLHVLRGVDCHCENVVASGEHLVLVDAEALLHPDAAAMGGAPEGDPDLAADRFRDSVIRTGLLPRWEFDGTSTVAYDVSGLGNVVQQAAPRPVLRWTAVNTDDMEPAYVTASLPVRDNVPRLEGDALRPEQHVEALVGGFRRTYRFLLENRERLLETAGPLARFAGLPGRYLFRATHVYGVLAQRVLAPRLLGGGVDRGIELDRLARPFITSATRPLAWPLLRAELEAMERMDTPYFGMSTSRRSLVLPGGAEIDGYFDASGLERVQAQVRALGEEDLDLQVAIVEAAFQSRAARASVARGGAEEERIAAGDLTRWPPPAAAALVEEAVAIAREIQRRAVRGSGGTVHWFAARYVEASDRYQLEPLGPDLYAGRCGVALFLAALDQATSGSEFHDLALAAVEPVRRALRSRDAARRFADQAGIGGALGVGSIVYGFARLGRLLHETALLDDAMIVAELVTPRLVAADRHYDVIGGAGGAILGLLALHGETGVDSVLERARACGAHLLAHRTATPEGARTWRGVGGVPLAGFSHGAAGIAYALLRLFAAGADDEILEAARGGIAFERGLFSEEARNWPDLRTSAARGGSPSFPVSWCHGAAGIGLARLGGRDVLGETDVDDEIEAALATTRGYAFPQIDHVCCGNFGRVELMLVAGQRLARADLVDDARRRAGFLTARASRAGHYPLFPDLPPAFFSPGFFQGTAGIGYQLLRCAHPDDLPSILLWD
jgi:type 2 lantibiotic biosynthesis protein LanM